VEALQPGRYCRYQITKGYDSQRSDPCNLLFDFYCIVADPSLWSNEKIDAAAKGGPEGMRLVTLKAVSGPGDDGEPVMTFMLPEED
jgi:hypothetical protein